MSDIYVKTEIASGTYPTGLIEAGLVVDISFLDFYEEESKVTGDFELSLFTDGNYPYAQMYHEGESGDWELIGGSYSKGYITANVEEFSKYGILAEERFDILVEKVWVGEVGEAVTVNLYKDGVFYDYRTLSESNDWKDSFDGMPAYENGELIEYTVEEEEVPENYEVDISGSAEGGFVITNTEILDEPEEGAEEESEGETLPKIATNNYNLLLIGSLLLIIGIFIAIVLQARRNLV